MKRGVSNKGVSAVVATVLIILITVAAVVLIWTTVLPMIKKNISSTNPTVDLSIDTQNGYTLWDEANQTACVQIKRGSDNVSSIVGMNIIFEWNGTSDSRRLNSSFVPAANQEKQICFNLAGKGRPSSVSVVSVTKADNTEASSTPSTVSSIPTGSSSGSGSGSTGSGVQNDFQPGPSASTAYCGPKCSEYSVNDLGGGWTSECNAVCTGDASAYCASLVVGSTCDVNAGPSAKLCQIVNGSCVLKKNCASLTSTECSSVSAQSNACTATSVGTSGCETKSQASCEGAYGHAMGNGSIDPSTPQRCFWRTS